MYQLSRLLHDHYKDLYDHFEAHDIAPTLYAAPWFLTMFASQFPLGFVARVYGKIIKLCRPPPPVGWGSTYRFTAVGVGVPVGVTPITKAPPAQIFFWVACFLFPRSLAFDFCYDLDIWGQGQALRAFFCSYEFFHYFVKSVRVILIKHGRKLHRHLPHDPIIVDL